MVIVVDGDCVSDGRGAIFWNLDIEKEESTKHAKINKSRLALQIRQLDELLLFDS